MTGKDNEGHRQAVGGQPPGPNAFVFKFKHEVFKDHTGNDALRLYKSDQDPSGPSLQPPFAIPVYITQPIQSRLRSLGEEIFEAITDEATFQYWRLECFVMPTSPGNVREACAEHFRAEKMSRKGSALKLPDFANSHCNQYSGFAFLVTDMSRWTTGGSAIYLFDGVPGHIGNEEGHLEERFESNLWEESLVGGILKPEPASPLLQILGYIWNRHKRRVRLMADFDDAREEGRTDWG